MDPFFIIFPAAVLGASLGGGLVFAVVNGWFDGWVELDKCKNCGKEGRVMTLEPCPRCGENCWLEGVGKRSPFGTKWKDEPK
jgi:hypothetical protein